LQTTQGYNGINYTRDMAESQQNNPAPTHATPTNVA
jgi:hypothetical protein